jgi:hypothetical protein
LTSVLKHGFDTRADLGLQFANGASLLGASICPFGYSTAKRSQRSATGKKGRGLFFPAAVVDVQERPIPNPFASMAFLNLDQALFLSVTLGETKGFWMFSAVGFIVFRDRPIDSRNQS